MKKSLVTLSGLALLTVLASPVFALEPGTTIDPNNHSAIEAPTAEALPTLDIEASLAAGESVYVQVPAEAPTASDHTAELKYEATVVDGEVLITAVPTTAPTKEALNLKGAIDKDGKGYVYGIATDVEVPTEAPAAKVLPKTSVAK